jgi:16S rRNA (cytosine967-C5)-methyltransferase
MPAAARIAAFQALRAIATGRADLPAALALSRDPLSDERDRALASDIVTGTLRWRRSADHLIVHFAGRPAARIDDDILEILRLSVYQLLHLDRVPASAVVDDAVDLARYARKKHASGFVNAVLRSLLRDRHRLPLPARPGSGADRAAAVEYLGITHSHPEWLVSRWLDRYGFDAAEAWVRFNNEAAKLTLRTNTLKTTRDALSAALRADGVETGPARYAPDGLIVESGNPMRLKGDGSFFVQDEASQLVALTLDARPGERILDLCASPGGKSVAFAAAMNDMGMIVASDIRARRMRLLRVTVAASGVRCIRVVHIPSTGPLPFRSTFDRVLIDAPCSGLGTVRRDPDIRWRRSETDLESFASSQLALIGRAADLVRPGGRLVYATCSSEPEENEAVIDAFLAARNDFALLDLRTSEPGTLAPPHLRTLAPFLDIRGMFRTLPFAHGLEAFFAAAIVRGTISI